MKSRDLHGRFSGLSSQLADVDSRSAQQVKGQQERFDIRSAEAHPDPFSVVVIFFLFPALWQNAPYLLIF